MLAVGEVDRAVFLLAAHPPQVDLVLDSAWRRFGASQEAVKLLDPTCVTR
jgi:hypothetical protein